MLLVCRYGTDPAHPERGIVEAWKNDGETIDMSLYPGCVLVSDDAEVHARGKFGDLKKLGDPPIANYPSHAELDAKGVAKDHRLRKVAGQPFPDNRKTEVDLRRWRAPDLTLDVLRATAVAALTAACDAELSGGFVSAALGAPHTYPSTETDQRNLSIAAGAAIMGQSKPGWTASLMCRDASGVSARVPHTPAQLHQVLGDYQAFDGATRDKLDALKARVAAASTAADIATVAWA